MMPKATLGLVQSFEMSSNVGQARKTETGRLSPAKNTHFVEFVNVIRVCRTFHAFKVYFLYCLFVFFSSSQAFLSPDKALSHSSHLGSCYTSHL